MSNSRSIAPIVVCTEIENRDWRWIEASLKDTDVKFEFSRCAPTGAVEKITRFNVARLQASFEAVQTARRIGARAIVTHGPTLAAWSALFARLLGFKAQIVAHSFNFTALPSAIKRRVFKLALSRVDRFVVFSTVERELYAKAFALPADKFDVVLWGVRPPLVDAPEIPLENGDYICAVGGNARDYHTLIAAARRLPDLRFVLVVRPDSLNKLELPSNIVVHVNLPSGKTMNVLKHARFMVLPLVDSSVPCGHVTLVSAMYLAKAFIITDSLGVHDYVRDGENALTVAAGSVEELVSATSRLWNDPELCTRLGENGLRFATHECTEERIAMHFRGWLQTTGMITS